ncbi:hypothetical protein PENTCL1PPCAC_24492, partial [Pristionchus entomophagus]
MRSYASGRRAVLARISLFALAVFLLKSSLRDVVTLWRSANGAHATYRSRVASLLEALELLLEFLDDEGVVGLRLLPHGIAHVLRGSVVRDANGA